MWAFERCFDYVNRFRGADAYAYLDGGTLPMNPPLGYFFGGLPINHVYERYGCDG